MIHARAPGLSLSWDAALADLTLALALLVLVGVYGIPLTVVDHFVSPANEAQHWLVTQLFGAALFVAVILASIWWRQLPLASLGTSRDSSLQQVMRGMCGAALVWLVAQAVSVPADIIRGIASGVTIARELEYSGVSTTRTNELLSLLATGVVVGFYEETLFRGFMLPRLQIVTGRAWIAVCVCSAAFAQTHLDRGVILALEAYVGSLALCALYLRWGSLLSVAIAHAGYNVLITLLVVRP